MGINTTSDEEATLQIGPTDQGMVRIFVSGQAGEISMDFEPEEAEEIAHEILTAVEIARGQSGKATKR